MSPPTPSDSPPSTPLPLPHTQNNQPTKLHPTKLRQQWSNRLQSDADYKKTDQRWSCTEPVVRCESSYSWWCRCQGHGRTGTQHHGSDSSPDHHDNQQITMTTKDHHDNRSPCWQTGHHDHKQISMTTNRSPWQQKITITTNVIITVMTNRSPHWQTGHHDHKQIIMTTITMTTEWWQTDHHIDRSPWPQAINHDNQQTTTTTITMMTNRSPCWQTGHHDHKHDNQQITTTNKWNGKDVGCTYAMSNKRTSWSFSAAVQDIIIASAISPTAVS